MLQLLGYLKTTDKFKQKKSSKSIDSWFFK